MVSIKIQHTMQYNGMQYSNYLSFRRFDLFLGEQFKILYCYR